MEPPRYVGIDVRQWAPWPANPAAAPAKHAGCSLAGPGASCPVQELGKLIIGVGVLLVIIGLIVWRAPGMLSWFGKLPGDLSIQKGNFSFYFPLATCLLISVILTVLAWLFRR